MVRSTLRVLIPVALLAAPTAASASVPLPTVRNRDLPGLQTRGPRQHFHTVDDAVIADPLGTKHPVRVRKHYAKFGFVRGAWQVFTLHDVDAGNSLTMQYPSARRALAATKDDAHAGPGKVTAVGKLPHGLMSVTKDSPGTIRRQIFFARGTVEFRISLASPQDREPGVAPLIAEGRKLLKRA